MIARLVAVGLLLVAAGCWIALGRSNDPAYWIPVEVGLPVEAGEAVESTFVAEGDGYYEVQVEAAADLDPTVLERHLTVTHRDGDLRLSWQVHSAGETVAGGEAASYLYVERGPRSRIAQLKRVVLRMPYGRDAAHRGSFGLRGAPTAARGIGRFRVADGEPYTIRAEVGADLGLLAEGSPTLVVRPERRRWQNHFDSARRVGYLGSLCLVAGVGVLVLSFVRRGPVA